ncbi:hypothetical protein NTE_01804 [Candidatus Nitrososphaera evergladensis SR1]|uniref:Uncharacterized protein n=1 Tax=Candidatus Nitrososphaera evergladensis SR1 TaxID=1459636 RepID=A0A075MRY8_9ARCH|nr:hypothetical protein NTE_01804 [Candidatus Nitrososphaera evergladensis SR1]
MANSQYILKTNAPSSPAAWGVSVEFVVPNGVTSLASTSTGKWCTAANIFGTFDGIPYGLPPFSWVECSVTYFASGGARAQGWYFWYGWIGNTAGTYQSLSYDPTGHTIRLKLKQVFGAVTLWTATFVDLTNSTTISQPINGAQVINKLGGSWMFFENGGNTDCHNYVNAGWGPLDFNNHKFYDQNDNVITFTPTVVSDKSNPAPACCAGQTDCIGFNTSTLTISRNCTSC